MIDSSEEFDSLAELEAMLFSAGSYVRASDDLRPRVLETAKGLRRDRRICRRLRASLFTIVLSFLCLDAVDPPLRQLLSEPQDPQRIIEAEDIYRFSKAQIVADDVGWSDEFGWGMVEAFNVMRLQQSRSLRPAM